MFTFNPTAIAITGLLDLRKAVQILAEGKPVVFTNEQQKEVYNYILEHQHAGKEVRQEHKERVIAVKDAKEEEEKQNLCPYCKIPLVLRKGKNGEFYGCSNFPKCRYTKKLQDSKQQKENT